MPQMPTEQHAFAWLAQERAWAILPQTLSVMSAFLDGRLAYVDALRQASQRAALREDVAPAPSSAVAVISLRGLVTPRGSMLDAMCGGSGGLAALREALTEAAGDPDVGSIVLDIDSPGGQVDGVPETAALLREIRAEKPVVAIANTMAASAAYWLAAQATEVVVSPSAVAGSIGVYTMHVDVSAAEEAAGVKPTLVSAGRYKTEGNPHEPLSPTARAALQELVDDTYGMFVADVALGRGVPEASVRDGYGEGRALGAQRAVRAGLADSVETLDATIARLGASAVVVPNPPPPAPAPDPEPAAAAVEAPPRVAVARVVIDGQEISAFDIAPAPEPNPEASEEQDPAARRRALEGVLAQAELGLA